MLGCNPPVCNISLFLCCTRNQYDVFPYNLTVFGDSRHILVHGILLYTCLNIIFVLFLYTHLFTSLIFLFIKEKKKALAQKKIKQTKDKKKRIKKEMEMANSDRIFLSEEEKCQRQAR